MAEVFASEFTASRRHQHPRKESHHHTREIWELAVLSITVSHHLYGLPFSQLLTRLWLSRSGLQFANVLQGVSNDELDSAWQLLGLFVRRIKVDQHQASKPDIHGIGPDLPPPKRHTQKANWGLQPPMHSLRRPLFTSTAIPNFSNRAGAVQV